MSERHCMIILFSEEHGKSVLCPRKHYARGLCSKHYVYAKRIGTLDNYLPPKPKTFRTGCDVEGCKEKHWALGYCHNHYRRIRNSGDPSHHRRLDGSMKIWKRKRRKRV